MKTIEILKSARETLQQIGAFENVSSVCLELIGIELIAIDYEIKRLEELESQNP